MVGKTLLLLPLIALLFSTMESHATCSPFTVSMTTGGTGQNAVAFTSDGTLGTDGGVTYFLHWDNTYLYLGWAGGTTTYPSDLYFAALNVGSGGSSGSIQGVSFSAATMDYYVVYENNSSYYGSPASNGDAFEVYQASGSSSWNWTSRTEPANNGISGRITFGTGSGAEVRIRVPWSSIGGSLPSSFSVVMWCNNPSGNNLWSSYPSSNPTGATPQTLTHGVSFSSTASGTCPASAQSAGLLPVELMHLSASAKTTGVELTWATASEQNSSHFEVQRSGDARHWQTLGEVESAGFSTGLRSYEFLDEKPLPLNFYRLRQVDFDQSANFSKVISVKFEGGNLPPRLSPNPVENELTLHFGQEVETGQVVLVFDQIGKLVLETALQAGNEWRFDVSQLSPGVYFFKIKEWQERFVKN